MHLPEAVEGPFQSNPATQGWLLNPLLLNKAAKNLA